MRLRLWTLIALSLLSLSTASAWADATNSWVSIAPVSPDARITQFIQSDPSACFASWHDCLIRISGSSVTLEKNSSKPVTLPNLPPTTAPYSAAVLGDSLYVLAGPDFLRLPLADKNPTWVHLPPIPVPRIAPAIAAQDGQIDVFGGRRAADGTPCDDAWAYRPAPRDGTNVSGWFQLQKPPVSIAHTAAVPAGQTHIFLLAGQILAYDTVTDTYTPAGNWDKPFAATIFVSLDSKNILIDPQTGSAVELKLNPPTRRLAILDYAFIAIYFILFASVGAYFSRRQKSTETFALGDRNVKWWLAGISLYATGTSAISYMAIPALTYSTNLLWWLPAVPLSALALFPQAYLVIPLIRRLNITSTFEYLERRFNRQLRLFGSAQCIIFQVAGRMAVVILLPAIAISAVTGISLVPAVLIMGCVTTIYTAIGGIDAVIWTDAIQTILTIGGPLLALGIIIASFGHHPWQIFSIGNHYSKFKLALFDWNFALPVIWIYIFSSVLGFTGFAGDQTMVQRVLSTKSDTAARRATITLFVFVAVGATLFHLLGVALFAYFHAHPSQLDPGMSNDQIVPLFIVQQMPVGIAGLLIAGIFGASMSTVSGTINSVATLVVEDFYRRLRPHATDRQRLRLMKITSYCVGIFATAVAACLAASHLTSIFVTWTKMVALLGGGFGGIFTLGIFTRRANSGGAIVGVVFGFLFTLFIMRYTNLHWSLYGAGGGAGCLIVGYAASFLFSPGEKDLTGLTIFTARKTQAASQPLLQPDL